MKNKALVVIDIQNNITKNYKDIIENLNKIIDWAERNSIHVVYIKNYNLSVGAKTFVPNTFGSDIVSDLNIVSNNIFIKTKSNALTSEDFLKFINENAIEEFYITGADATACVKSTSYNMCLLGYKVHIISDCITSYDKNKIAEMIEYYKSKGCIINTTNEIV